MAAYSVNFESKDHKSCNTYIIAMDEGEVSEKALSDFGAIEVLKIDKIISLG